jgi:lipoate---protein ligase
VFVKGLSNIHMPPRSAANSPNVYFERAAFLPYLADSGLAQMALDDAIFQELDSENTLLPELIIRCYTWEPATWSIGRFQKQSAALSLLIGDSPVVRRPTGGRAIFHQGDISFAFVTNNPTLLSMSVSESYCVFQKPLQAALLKLGIPLQGETACETPSKGAYQAHDLCFETHLPSEIMSRTGDKLCGMAQARRKNALLQHGAAFLGPWEITPQAFYTSLQEAFIESFFSGTSKDKEKVIHPKLDAWPRLQTHWHQLLETDYTSSDSATIWDRAETKSGSHF